MLAMHSEQGEQQSNGKDTYKKGDGGVLIDIPFPFQPYGVQKDFMQSLYQTLENKRIGIYESPTGTGKSLSLICSSLKWLKDNEKNMIENFTNSDKSETNNETDSQEPDWLASFSEQKMVDETTRKFQKMQEKKKRIQDSIAKMKDLHTRSKASGVSANQRKEFILKGLGHHRPKVSMNMSISDIKKSKLPPGSENEKPNEKKNNGAYEDDEFLVDNYASDVESGVLFDEMTSGSEDEDENDYSSNFDTPQILYVSRTHSQVSQFVNEIKKTAFKDDIRVVSLASRKNMCINEDVRHLGSETRINDKCLDLQKKTKSKAQDSEKIDGKTGKKRGAPKCSGSCEYLGKDSSPLQNTFRDYNLALIQDIEELTVLGRTFGTCPYYGVRKGVPLANVVAMPYTTLIHKGSREAMGIRIKGNIVIIDEAHNLIETINSVYNVEINVTQVNRSQTQLQLYLERYRNRLKGRNVFYISQILLVLRALATYLNRNANETRSSTNKMLSVNDFIFDVGIDNVNIFKIEKYIEKSNIAKKLLGFSESRRAAEVQINDKEDSLGDSKVTNSTYQNGEYVSNHISALQIVHTFLMALTNDNTDGRIFVDYTKGRMKFLMLNPSVHFKEIVDQAHSVILAGGTMHPINHIMSQLFSHVDKTKVDIFSCGHVIPPENLLTLTVRKGPTGLEFDFTHKKRGSDSQIDELGRLLLNVCSTVPGGVICFLPSFAYECDVVSRWTETGLLKKLSDKKSLFREPRQAKDVDRVLQEYTNYVRIGAILLCIVGAKMSEGINFADDLCRLVVMVGLPYPDITDPELQQKMAYVDSLNKVEMKSCESSAVQCSSGRDYYQNLCMRAVNQSIGRAIRHANDYSSIMLVDKRYYSDKTIISLLPGWISKRLRHAENFGDSFSQLARFFKSKKN